MSRGLTETVRVHAAPREHTPGGSQGVDRTLDLIEYLAATGGATTSQIAKALGVHRSIVYRMLNSLAARDFVRNENGTFALGISMLAMANAVPDPLRDATRAGVRELARETGVTAYIVVDAGGRSVCVLAEEPEGPQPRIVLRPGAWGPMDLGAPAYAILSARDPENGEPVEVSIARERGYAYGHGPDNGVDWIASPIRTRWESDACVGVLYPADSLTQESTAEKVMAAAARISATSR